MTNTTKTIEFFIPMKPPTVTQQEHKVTVRNGKPHFYEPAELKAARRKIRDHLAGHVPNAPMTGGIRLLVKWCFPTDDPMKNGLYRITKPDTDNLNKMLKDEMTKLHFWKDDAQVCQEIIEKFWALTPGLYIYAQQIEENVEVNEFG